MTVPSFRVVAPCASPDRPAPPAGAVPHQTLDTRAKTAIALRNGNTVAGVTFSYTLMEGDEDIDGLLVRANCLMFPSGATLRRTGSVYAELARGVFVSERKVDGVRPVVASERDPRGLMLTWSEPLEDTAMLAPSEFAVSAGGATNTVTDVTVSGITVALALTNAVAAGASNVTVSCTRPASNPIWDASGNHAEPFSGQPMADGAPVIDPDPDPDPDPEPDPEEDQEPGPALPAAGFRALGPQLLGMGRWVFRSRDEVGGLHFLLVAGCLPGSESRRASHARGGRIGLGGRARWTGRSAMSAQGPRPGERPGGRDRDQDRALFDLPPGPKTPNATETGRKGTFRPYNSLLSRSGPGG